MVGSAIERRLRSESFVNIVGPSSSELDLMDRESVIRFLEKERPEYLFLAAAKVGGIYANSAYPADFIYRNLVIECNLIHGAHVTGVRKLLFLGSSCIYPKNSPQPIKEEYLLGGKLEPTNEPYAVAKIAGIKLCESYNRQYGTNFISCMPSNLYGLNDRYDPLNAHVIPALIWRFHEAKEQAEAPVTIWGTGSPLREFLYVDDLADACVFLVRNYSGNDTINVGSGHEVTIKELAWMIRDIVGFKGEIAFDPSKPDGTARKLLDGSRLAAMGWRPKTGLEEGLRLTYEDFLKKDLQ